MRPAVKRERSEDEPSSSATLSSQSLTPTGSEDQASNFTWIYDNDGGRRGVKRTVREHLKVRKHAATASAAARLATMSKKALKHNGQSSKQTMERRRPSLLSQASSGDEPTTPDAQPWYILRMLGNPSSRDAKLFHAIGQRSTRALLWEIVTENTALWQSAYLISGTYSNTCGKPASAIHGISSGLIYLRGKALEAIHASLESGKEQHLTYMAIAMLAAWERRFGDLEASKLHMEAWKRSSFPPSLLVSEEANVCDLMEVCWLAYREHLESRANAPSTASTKHHYPSDLPLGFRRFPLNRPETRSLLHLVDQYARSRPNAADGITRSRALRIENMAWSPSHTLGHDPGNMPCVAYEETWDGKELWALYHIRAALVSLTGCFGIAAHSAHNVQWVGDIAPGLEVHTNSCIHLRTEDLMGGRYQEIALWAQFTMCSISRVPSRDRQLRRWMACCGIETWPQMQALLDRHLHPELMGTKTEELYRTLMDS